jgi:hypothetical protein
VGRTLKAAAFLGLAAGLAACSPVAPTRLAAPTLASVLPELGSTGGATDVAISGTDLPKSVTFGGVVVEGHFDSLHGSTRLHLRTPVHEAGSVDVVVHGSGGEVVTLADAFTYAPPETFDFNGDWLGWGNTSLDVPMHFTIQHNELLRATCESHSIPGVDADATVTFSPPRPVTNGEFSFTDDAGVVLSGRILSATTATGVVRLGICSNDEWYAGKQ